MTKLQKIIKIYHKIHLIVQEINIKIYKKIRYQTNQFYKKV